MKIYTSYFAQLRKFPRNLVPLSTAAWPPKFFGTPENQHRDSRGIVLGLNIPPFRPGKMCEGLCFGNCQPKHPQDCAFLKVYRQQLDKIDINKVIVNLNKMSEKIKENEHLDDVDFALMVYETPTNPCSERVVIQQWFKDNGVEVNEWASLV